MKCSYHPAVDSQEFCTACNRPLCAECAHRIKSKCYCQECLVRGAEWAAAVKDLHIAADSPKRAAFFALIPGMGAVYNSEYLKAITFFAVFAALSIMGDRIHGIFGFGAFVFLIFSMFDAYRTAEARARARLESGARVESPSQDRTVVAWGIFLIVLGILFLLQNIISYYFLNRLWPLVFIGLGIYLVFRAIQDKERRKSPAAGVTSVGPGTQEEAQSTQMKQI
jgi:hypothetical protein